MRLTTRSSRSIAQSWSPASSSRLRCPKCKRHISPFATSSARAADAVGSNFTSRLRKRIWGTESPPGQTDPYRKGDEGSASSAPSKGKSAPKPETIDGSYHPATTWDGIEMVGGYGKWWKDNWDPEHPVRGFMPSQRLTDTYAITAALHRAVVEVFIFKNAGRSLSELSNVPGIDLTGKVDIRPATDGGAMLEYNDSEIEKRIIQAALAAVEEPTQSEQDVRSDQSPIDPLREELEASSEKLNSTESEADVAADRSAIDPLKVADDMSAARSYQQQIESWDPAWLQISLQDAEVKFAVCIKL